MLLPVLAAPVLAFTSLVLVRGDSPLLSAGVSLGWLMMLALGETLLTRRHAETIRLADTPLELRGRTLVHLDAQGRPMGEVDLSAPFRFRVSSHAAGCFTVVVESSAHDPVVFTSALPAAREIIEEHIGRHYPKDPSG